MAKKFDYVNFIIDYEQGNLSQEDTLKLFSYLIRTGQCWTLQGHYGRTAEAIMEQGFIDKNGKILLMED